MLWFCEYFRAGSGEPVNLSMGLQSKDEAIRRGKIVSQVNGYCGFWVTRKKSGSPHNPIIRVEYHAVFYDPRGVPAWRSPLQTGYEVKT